MKLRSSHSIGILLNIDRCYNLKLVLVSSWFLELEE